MIKPTASKFSTAIVVITLYVSFLHNTIAQKKALSTKEPAYLISIGGKKTFAEDFKYVYEKNNNSTDEKYSDKSLRDYLELYTRFRLKVMDAEKMGLDTTSAFKTEFETYRKQLATPYLTEKKATDGLVKEAYERMKSEVRASHILFAVSQEADPLDTLKAYSKAIEIRKKLISGEDFIALAKKISEDPSATNNGGDLGYFTALQMVYPFENAAFNLPVGEVSMPVRSKFGYHLIKVLDKRASKGEVKVAHIMVQAFQNMPKADSITLYKKAKEIYTKAKAGEEWKSLCSQFSDDQGSKASGGELPFFSTGLIGVPVFENTAFSLANPGDIAEPVLSPYGWHIIKMIEKKSLLPFSELESTLKQKVNRDQRSELNNVYFIERIRKENQLVEKPKNLDIALVAFDSSILKAKWSDAKVRSRDRSLVLFTIANIPYAADAFYNYALLNQSPKTKISPNYHGKLLYQDFMEKSLMDYEEANLGKKYKDYSLLTSEYRDGILLFQLMDKKVWSKAIDDSAGIQNFYNTKKNSYMWEQRVNVQIFNCATEAIRNQVKEKLKSGVVELTSTKFNDILFKTNTFTLDESAMSKLVVPKDILLKNPKMKLEITAYADKSELKSDSKIAVKRANEIKKYLIANNVDSTKLILKSIVSAASQGNITDRTKAGLKLFTTSVKELEKEFNSNQALNLQITEGKFQKHDNEIIDSVEPKVGEFNIEKNNRFILLKILSIEEPRAKYLNECKGLVISDYQNKLEEDWINSLKQEYKINVNEFELKKLIKP